MFKISRDNPAYYLTSVTHNRLPIFQKDDLKRIVCDAFDEARRTHGILIFAYVIMLDHTHFLTDNAHPIKDVLRYLNGVSANKVIKFLKSNDHESTLAKLRIRSARASIIIPFTSTTRTRCESPARMPFFKR